MFKFEKSAYGQKAIASSPWTNEMTQLLLEKKIVDLELNDGKGWRGSDISFLKELPQLRSFTLIDLKISSDEPIHFLHELPSLKLITYCKKPTRFGEFPFLEECSLEWRSKSDTLFDCIHLKNLFLNRYKGRDVEPFSKLVNLEYLKTFNSPIKDLQGLRNLKKLRSLELARLNQLTSLAGIEELKHLEELEIHTCRLVESIEEIAALPKLETLALINDGNIASLKPLENLTALKAVLFYESTNIVDGDLSPLKNNKRLSKISFQNRGHYSHLREEFGSAFSR